MPSETILIADRQTHVVQTMTTRLRAAGYYVAAAENGMEAYALARSIRPDLIIADYQIPKLSGPELCTRLSCDPLTSHIPVMLMTAGGINNPSITVNNIVCTINKPCNPQKLLDVVQAVLEECTLVRTR